MSNPALIISLDFELFWGVRDVLPLRAYRENLLGVRQAIPALLRLFAERDIHATWATVGFLFCGTKDELRATLPRRLPAYADTSLSPYDLTEVGQDEASDPFHFAPSLVRAIAETRGQELATHTFSHFYCLEAGQTADDFDADLESATVAAKRLGVELRSLVFPRNQYNPSYGGVMARRGIRAFRSTVGGWPYTPGTAIESRAKRAVRLADAYLPIAGRRSFPLPSPDPLGLTDVPASAFLRPFSPTLRPMDGLKVRRILGAMSRAAVRGEMFHLWWHPHNFGVNLRENLAMLITVLDHFRLLSDRYGMRSLSMQEVAALASARPSPHSQPAEVARG